jgi:16S rRNA (cytidine1402-2'-O)-methyltransferase
MAKLYIIATPIGNLEDLTLRALRILKEVDFVLAEDKRVTAKLLNFYKLDKKLLTWQQHSSGSDWQVIKKLLVSGKDLALVSDAGTPGISDPGGKLIELILSELPNVEIIPIPGPSALAAIISIAGVALDNFSFYGFLPHKKGRQTLINKIKEADVPVIFFESVHRIDKTLAQLADCPKKLIVGRELTKQFETVYRGSAESILKILKENPKALKGEFVIIVDKQ